MPYILNKTNGTIVATVQDAATDFTTDLTFVGRNYAGYGEVQNENFLKLLENFSNTEPPTKPIIGQIWFNSSEKRFYGYDGADWKGVSNVEVSSTNPSTQKLFGTGDLWYDVVNQQLKIYNGTEFTVVGPPSGADNEAGWRGSYEYNPDEGFVEKYNIKAVVGANDDVIAVVSAETYNLSIDFISESFSVYPNIEKIYKGITLTGADKDTGISYSGNPTDTILWGTAAHSLVANTALNSGFASGSEYIVNTNTNQTYYVYFAETNLDSTSSFFIDNSGLNYNPATKTLSCDIFDGIATSAYYADLAERYHSDEPYDEGTVVIIGGEFEITTTNIRANPAIAGVISNNPAFMMNKDAGSDSTHPYVALKGRVPCKVVGPIKKGERLVSSSKFGYAEAWRPGDDSCSVIGKSLEDFNENSGIIEIKI